MYFPGVFNLAPYGFSNLLFPPISQKSSEERAQDPLVISTIWGSLLGDGWGERRGNSTRLHLHYSTKNMEYVRWLQNFFAERQLCSRATLRISKQISKSSRVYYSVKLRTYSFSSWNSIYDAFYSGGKKRVPPDCVKHITPQALAIWCMDDGGRGGAGFKLSTEGFTREDVGVLQSALKERYGLHWTIQRHKARWCLYLPRQECGQLKSLLEPLFVPTMRYKLNFSEGKSAKK